MLVGILEGVAVAVEMVAIAILVLGFSGVLILSTPELVRVYDRSSPEKFFDVFRRIRLSLGQILLLALEILIMSDIILTILHRTIDEITILGLTVVIRIGLSYFLNLEMDHLNKEKSEV